MCVLDLAIGEGFILINNEEDGGEEESRNSGSGEDTDGGYRSNNGNNSPTANDARGVSTTVKNYGSINRSTSDGRQATARELGVGRGGAGWLLVADIQVYACRERLRPVHVCEWVGKGRLLCFCVLAAGRCTSFAMRRNTARH